MVSDSYVRSHGRRDEATTDQPPTTEVSAVVTTEDAVLCPYIYIR